MLQLTMNVGANGETLQSSDLADGFSASVTLGLRKSQSDKLSREVVSSESLKYNLSLHHESASTIS